MNWIALLILGLGGGIMSGFLGIGGGVILIPALIYFFHFSQHGAQGTTLAAMVPPIGLLAALAYYKAGHVNVKAAGLLAAGFILGGWIGRKFVQYIPDVMLKKGFALFLLFIAIRMWMEK